MYIIMQVRESSIVHAYQMNKLENKYTEDSNLTSKQVYKMHAGSE